MIESAQVRLRCNVSGGFRHYERVFVMSSPLRLAVSLLLATGIAVASLETTAMAACLQGVNLAGAEFGQGRGVYGKDYIYPSAKTIDHFAAKGMTVVRLPFKWERLQPKLDEALDVTELQRLKATVALARGRGMVVILDPHNYAAYDDVKIGAKGVPVSAFAGFWGRLAAEFHGDKGIYFGLMNEPNQIDVRIWLDAANAAINAIRAVGAKNLILVPGTNHTGGQSWFESTTSGVNADVMGGVRDPANNYAYEFHQYLNHDFSGGGSDCDSEAAGLKAIADVSGWLRQQGKKGFLGEIGVPANKACLNALSNALRQLERNGDAWIGWSYWAAGDWWPESEPLNIQPTAKGDRGQLPVLLDAISRRKKGASCKA